MCWTVVNVIFCPVEREIVGEERQLLILTEPLTAETRQHPERRRRDRLEHSTAAVGHPLDEFGELDVARVRTRHRPTCDRPVEDRPGSGEPDGAGGDRLGRQPAHLGNVGGRRVFVVRAAFAHDVKPQRSVRELRSDVERVVTRLEEVEVFGEGLPRAPRHTFVQRTPRNVFDAFHQLDQRCLLARRARREAHPAVAHHQRGDAVAERRVELVVPRCLAVVMGVHVHPTRRHDRTVGIDHAISVEGTTDGRDPATVDRDITREPVGPGAVHDRPAPNHHVVCH